MTRNLPIIDFLLIRKEMVISYSFEPQIIIRQTYRCLQRKILNYKNRTRSHEYTHECTERLAEFVKAGLLIGRPADFYLRVAFKLLRCIAVSRRTIGVMSLSVTDILQRSPAALRTIIVASKRHK